MSGGKVRPADLNLPVEPPGRYLWLWTVFQTLNHGRQYTPNGLPLPITQQEILAWCNLYDEKLTKRELWLLRALDTTFINTRIELQRECNQ